MPRIDPADIPPSPNLNFESALWNNGLRRVAGLDEAGRGAWAGPVCAAVVVLPPHPGMASVLRGVRDSKQMAPAARREWAKIIKEACWGWCAAIATSEEIDEFGILPATKLAMYRAINRFYMEDFCFDAFLLDALFLPEDSTPQTSLIKGDQRSLSIAAASVLAKTERDRLMEEMDGKYPGYGFARHKGYGTKVHQTALDTHGPCPEHRRSYGPVLRIL